MACRHASRCAGQEHVEVIESTPTYTGARAGRVGNRRVQQKEAKSVAVAITSRTFSYWLCTHLREGWRSMRAVLIASSSVDCASSSQLLTRRMLVYMRSILVRFLRYRRSGTVRIKRAINRPPMRQVAAKLVATWRRSDSLEMSEPI